MIASNPGAHPRNENAYGNESSDGAAMAVVK